MLKYASLYGGQLTSLEEIKSRSTQRGEFKKQSPWVIVLVGDIVYNLPGAHVNNETGFNKKTL